jgi:hypothetical protein
MIGSVRVHIVQSMPSEYDWFCQSSYRSVYAILNMIGSVRVHIVQSMPSWIRLVLSEFISFSLCHLEYDWFCQSSYRSVYTILNMIGSVRVHIVQSYAILNMIGSVRVHIVQSMPSWIWLVLSEFISFSNIKTRKVEQMYITSKCGHSILLGTVNSWTK